MDNRIKYDKELQKWAKGHCWDSLESQKDLIFRHLRTFCGDFSDEIINDCAIWNFCPHCGRSLK